MAIISNLNISAFVDPIIKQQMSWADSVEDDENKERLWLEACSQEHDAICLVDSIQHDINQALHLGLLHGALAHNLEGLMSAAISDFNLAQSQRFALE
jgi:hypothetical protein